jgi:hypothetical protein
MSSPIKHLSIPLRAAVGRFANPAEDEAMKWNHLAATAALAMGSMAACAEQPPAAPTAPSAQVASPADGEFYRLHTLAEYPALTPEEMSRRVLKLIDSFKSKEDWNVAHIRKVTGMPIAPVKGEEGFTYAFMVDLPDSGWGYGIDYSTNPQDNYDYTNVTLRFINQVGQQHFDNADMAPVCGMDFQAFDAALRSMGYAPKPKYDEIGRLTGINYYAAGKFAWIIMLLRPEGYGDDAKRGHACVRELSIRRP